ncbi:MAG: serine/threonine protein kinase [Deltaproteobacteria bacterium]|nr:MAG: serine/threonine protein kinase [Deltaproteobacteria bacterium]
MAEIFVARREAMEGFQKTIVIKRIRPHLSDNPTFVKMFLNEAKLAAQLNHSNIAQIFDLGRIGRSYFIAMEYIDGRDMRTIVPKARKKGIDFPIEYSLKVARDVCEGLYYAHRKTDEKGNPLNIVHRDVSPENIMVSFDGEVKILDFGIAKAENLISETRAGEIKGKLAYLSPEQVAGKTLDQRSDIFSLGAMLYEWIAGHKLFTGSSDVEVLKAILEARIYPPSYFRKEIPEELDEIVLRALARNRQERYQNAWEMLADIDQFLASHTFVPSNIHLSNFLRQIFADELSGRGEDFDEPDIEVEDQRQDQDRHEPTPVFVVSETGPGRNDHRDPVGKAAATGGDGRMVLNVSIERDIYGRIEGLARARGRDVAEVAAEILASYARLLPGEDLGQSEE